MALTLRDRISLACSGNPDGEKSAQNSYRLYLSIVIQSLEVHGSSGRGLLERSFALDRIIVTIFTDPTTRANHSLRSGATRQMKSMTARWPVRSARPSRMRQYALPSPTPPSGKCRHGAAADSKKTFNKGQGMAAWQCGLCSHIYDEAKEGTRWADLPDDWTCPACGSGEDSFTLVATAAPATGASPASSLRSWFAHRARASRNSCASHHRSGTSSNPTSPRSTYSDRVLPPFIICVSMSCSFTLSEREVAS